MTLRILFCCVAVAVAVSFPKSAQASPGATRRAQSQTNGKATSLASRGLRPAHPAESLAPALAPVPTAAAPIHSALPHEGVYSGELTQASGVVPLDISLKYTEEEIPGDADEIIPFKKKIVGSFMLAEEGGPLSFTTVDYNLETGELDLRYQRPGVNSSGVITLRFEGRVQADGSIKGQVTSGLRGDLGTFKVAPHAGLTSLVPRTHVAGHYVGTWTFRNDNHTEPFEISLRAVAQPTTNPPDMELDFTPGRIGSGFFSQRNLTFSFSQVVIDYFRNTIRMIYTGSGNSNSPTGGGGTLTLEATIQGDTLTGVANSALGTGVGGTFIVKRVNQ